MCFFTKGPEFAFVTLHPIKIDANRKIITIEAIIEVDKKIIGDIIPIISEAKWNLRFCTFGIELRVPAPSSHCRGFTGKISAVFEKNCGTASCFGS